MIKTILLTASKTSFQIACNGKSVLQRLPKTNITDPNEPYADLLSSTHHLLTACNLRVQLHHIKGHQDARNFGPYTRDATLNIEADRLAREKLDDYKPGQKNFHIPWSQGICYTGQHQTIKDFATYPRPYQWTSHDHLLDQAQAIVTGYLEHFRLCVDRKSHEGNSHQPKAMGVQIRVRTFCHREKHATLEIQNVSTVPAMPGNKGRQTAHHDMSSPQCTREMDKITEGDRGLAQRGTNRQNHTSAAYRIPNHVDYSKYNANRSQQPK